MSSKSSTSSFRRMLKTISPAWWRDRDRLTMRAKPLKTRDLILSLSKDEAKISCFFSSPQADKGQRHYGLP